MLNPRVTLGFGLIVMSLLVLGGCPQPTPPAVTLPDALQSLVDQAADFTDLSARTLEPAPLDIASAADVDGCWAQAESQLARDVPGFGDVLLEVFEVYRFDATAGTARYELFMRNDTAQPDLLIIAEGTFTVPDAGALHVVLNQWTGNDARTGALIEIPNAQTLDTVFAAQLGESVLVLTPDSAQDGTSGAGEPIRYAALTCPE